MHGAGAAARKGGPGRANLPRGKRLFQPVSPVARRVSASSARGAPTTPCVRFVHALGRHVLREVPNMTRIIYPLLCLLVATRARAPMKAAPKPVKVG